MSARQKIAAERVGNLVRLDASFLTELVQDALADAWEPSRRVEFEEYVYARQRADEVVPTTWYDAPDGVNEEAERATEEVADAWSALDLTPSLHLSLETARDLYDLLGTALAAGDGSVARLVPAPTGRAA